MLDVSLTGNISIADSFVVLEEEIEAAVLTNEVFRDAENTFLKTLFGRLFVTSITDNWEPIPQF